MRRVTALQLLKRDEPAGEHQMEVRPNPYELPPDRIASAEPGLAVPKFGSQSLIELSGALAESGFTIFHLDLRDRYLNQLVPEGDHDLESELLKLVRAGDVNSALRILNGPARGVYLFAIEFRDQTSPGLLIVNRDGAVMPSGAAETAKFLDLVRSIWARLRP